MAASPFSELGACRGNEYLLRLRCKAILDELGAVPAELRPTDARLLLQDTHTVKLAGLGGRDLSCAAPDRQDIPAGGGVGQGSAQRVAVRIEVGDYQL